ncbi:MAG: sigma factor-like helix-turn-helix DNA-binding protein [Eubacteriales bacterium]|nr:sigma factor-like helix-turn-helix DNA-binding protein [Eubacteriales bacterium]
MGIEDLRDYRRLCDKQRDFEARKEALFERATSVTQQLSFATAKSGERDKLSRYVADLDELDKALTEAVIAAERKRQEIERAIDRLHGPERDVLELRYIQGLSWRQIAKRLHFSEKHPYYLHKAALKKLSWY